MVMRTLQQHLAFKGDDAPLLCSLERADKTLNLLPARTKYPAGSANTAAHLCRQISTRGYHCHEQLMTAMMIHGLTARRPWPPKRSKEALLPSSQLTIACLLEDSQPNTRCTRSSVSSLKSSPKLICKLPLASAVPICLMRALSRPRSCSTPAAASALAEHGRSSAQAGTAGRDGGTAHIFADSQTNQTRRLSSYVLFASHFVHAFLSHAHTGLTLQAPSTLRCFLARCCRASY